MRELLTAVRDVAILGAAAVAAGAATYWSLL